MLSFKLINSLYEIMCRIKDICGDKSVPFMLCTGLTVDRRNTK